MFLCPHDTPIHNANFSSFAVCAHINQQWTPQNLRQSRTHSVYTISLLYFVCGLTSIDNLALIHNANYRGSLSHINQNRIPSNQQQNILNMLSNYQCSKHCILFNILNSYHFKGKTVNETQHVFRKKSCFITFLN